MASSALKELYAEGNYDFHYVSHVANKNLYANQRLQQLNCPGYPDVYFDAGQEVKIGAYSTLPAQKAYYTPALTNCGNRTVPALDVNLSVQWIGPATMNIAISVTNNDDRTYSGTLRVYVAEIVSSLNWKLSNGTKYGYPFLQYAWNQAIVIPTGNTFSDSMVWDGALYNNGYGVDYGTIQYDNTAVFGVVFNSTGHLSYAYPPSSNPFTAYYSDQAVKAVPDSLTTDTDTLSAAGGTANLGLYAGGDYANYWYVVLGSKSGSSPGFALPDGDVLPINWDSFTDLVIGKLNLPVFSNFLGQLGADGTANAQINLPAINPSHIGSVLTFAYAADINGDYIVSNPVDIEIIP